VEGAVVDADGPRAAYVRVRAGRVREVGAIGTDASRGRVRRVRGIVTPPFVDGHTHLGDAAFDREPPLEPLARIVAPPDGIKFRFLAATPERRKRAATRAALRAMAREGVAATVDFREEGLAGVRLLRSAARGVGLRPFVLGRPLRRPIEPGELAALLREAYGIGLSSAREENRETREAVARACRRAGKRFALHASEDRREPVDEYLRPRPDLLVHLTRATPDDLAAVADAGIAVAVCPRSNALFGQAPPLAELARSGAAVLLGTDNAMLAAPSLLRELEFAYASARLRDRSVSPEFLLGAATVQPWRWLGRPEVARVGPDNPLAPLLFRLPPDDPAYQVVARASEHVMMRLGSPRPGRARPP
jgi:cytosine/adenosine deaminase-related metal-dependent hydrolase